MGSKEEFKLNFTLGKCLFDLNSYLPAACPFEKTQQIVLNNSSIVDGVLRAILNQQKISHAQKCRSNQNQATK